MSANRHGWRWVTAAALVLAALSVFAVLNAAYFLQSPATQAAPADLLAVLGGDGVSGVRVKDLAQGATREIACTGFFANVGLTAACEFAPPEIKRDAGGFLVTDGSMRTPLAGIYAAGAVRAGYGGLLSHAIAEAETAVASAAAALGK